MTEKQTRIKKKALLPPAYFLAFIVIMAALRFLLPGLKLLRFPWNLAGIVPFLAGGVIEFVSDRAFKRHRTTVLPFEESSVLVTEGAFRITRNPMYLGFVLILLGVGLLMGSLTPLAVVPVFAVLMDVKFIRAEEKMLEEKFGGAWIEYRNRVRRWI